MTWEIFLGLVALVGFIISVMTPILKLSKFITTLNNSLLGFRDTLSDLISDNTASHKEIWLEINGIKTRLLKLEMKYTFHHGDDFSKKDDEE